MNPPPVDCEYRHIGIDFDDLIVKVETAVNSLHTLLLRRRNDVPDRYFDEYIRRRDIFLRVCRDPFSRKNFSRRPPLQTLNISFIRAEFFVQSFENSGIKILHSAMLHSE